MTFARSYAQLGTRSESFFVSAAVSVAFVRCLLAGVFRVPTVISMLNPNPTNYLPQMSGANVRLDEEGRRMNRAASLPSALEQRSVTLLGRGGRDAKSTL